MPAPRCARRSATASISRRRVHAGDARAAHAPARSPRGRSRCRRRGSCGLSTGARNAAMTCSCVSAIRRPIGPLKRSASNALRHRGIGVDRVAVVVGSRRRAVPRSRDAARHLRRDLAGQVRAGLARARAGTPRSCTSCRRARRALSPTARARSGSVSAARIPAANPSGVALGQDRDVVVQHLRMRQQPRRDDRPARTQVLIDLQRRVGADAARRDQHVGGVEKERDLLGRPLPGEDRPRRRCRRVRPARAPPSI